MAEFNVRRCIAEMLQAAVENGYPTDWDNLSDEEIAEDLQSHDDDLAAYDTNYIAYRVGDYRCDYIAQKEFG